MPYFIEKTGVTHMVRDCAADSGGTTYDTEIGGMTHCGPLMKTLYYNGAMMEGCIMTCKANGCNGAAVLQTYPLLLLLCHLIFHIIISKLKVL